MPRVVPMFDERWLSLDQLCALEDLELCYLYLPEKLYALLPALTNLKYLKLKFSYLANPAALFLLFPLLSRLLSLDILRCQSTGHGFTGFQKYPLPPRLEYLNVSETQFFDDDCSLSSLNPATEECAVLKGLSANLCVIARVDSFLSCAASIRSLDLSLIGLQGEPDYSSPALVQLLRHTARLEELALSGRGGQGMTREVCRAISLMARLRELDLKGTNLSEDNILCLASGACRRSLRKLKLEDSFLAIAPGLVDDLAKESFDACAVVWDYYAPSSSESDSRSSS